MLDEISEMDIGLQAKLLRVIQEREVERLGGRKMIPLDVRVLATSNRNLHEEVAAGRFREDLFYRLNVFPLHLTPIRQRVGDIIPLANQMIERWGRNRVPKPVLTESAKQRLLEHSWPGNVRELDNVIQRALILVRGDSIDVDDLSFEIVGQQGSVHPGSSISIVPSEVQPITYTETNDDAVSVSGDDLKSREQQLILEVLEEVKGSRKAAAERLGISPRTLRYKLAKLREAGFELPG